MKKHLPTILLCGVFLIGLCLLLYPTVSNFYNSFHQSRAIASYDDTVSSMTAEDFTSYFEAAQSYNATLAGNPGRLIPTEESSALYNSLLNVGGAGVMGYIEIPSINVKLSIYHGTSEAVLATGVGHIEGTSLPVGGKGTHCVLSGHRGLPSAKLFTDLDQMKNGDVFYLHILDETLAYSVDQIRIVLPDEVDNLEIDPEQDYCTLITCTPYGVNSHRLLIRGHRVDYTEALNVEVTADASEIDSIVLLPAVALPILLVLLVALLLKYRRKKH